MTDRLLGPLVTPWALRRAARDLLTAGRLGIYLDEIVRQQSPVGRSVARIERPRDVVLRERAVRRAEEQAPLIVVACPGAVDARYYAGEGHYTGTLRLEIHALAEAADDDVAAETASVLALGAASLLLRELPHATGFQTRWIGMLADEPEDLDGSGERGIHAETHLLAVSGVLLSDIGDVPIGMTDPPIEEPPADPGDLRIVEEIAVTTTPVEEIDP